jgi:DNA mismatch endonuclease, patch repair protein
MSRIRAKDTQPELKVRAALHRQGYRFVLHDSRLPGKPDIVLPRYGVAVQVRGCFWHGHTCSDGHLPKSRSAYWLPKLAANKARDARNDRRIRKLGWKLTIVWECKCAKQESLEVEVDRILKLLKSIPASSLKRERIRRRH